MTPVAPWEEEAIQIVGEVISFWGFKENHGKIWALLYLRNTEMSTSAIRKYFSLSKGAVSMLLNDLESWNIIHRVHSENGRERCYTANKDLLEMISNVLSLREKGIVSSSIERLKNLEEQAKASDASQEECHRIRQMRSLAELMKQLLVLGSALNRTSIQGASNQLSIVARGLHL